MVHKRIDLRLDGVLAWFHLCSSQGLQVLHMILPMVVHCDCFLHQIIVSVNPWPNCFELVHRSQRLCCVTASVLRCNRVVRRGVLSLTHGAIWADLRGNRLALRAKHVLLLFLLLYTHFSDLSRSLHLAHEVVQSLDCFTHFILDSFIDVLSGDHRADFWVFPEILDQKRLIGLQFLVLSRIECRYWVLWLDFSADGWWGLRPG